MTFRELLIDILISVLKLRNKYIFKIRHCFLYLTLKSNPHHNVKLNFKEK